MLGTKESFIEAIERLREELRNAVDSKFHSLAKQADFNLRRGYGY